MALVCKPFGDIITFSRTSGATWFNAAGNLVGVDFSVTSNTIGTGSKTFTLDATAGVNRSWATGDSVLISDQSNSANNMTGTVTSYTASTQVLVVNVTSTGGSGTIASWRVSSLMPRLDYNPSTLAAQGLLIEEARTNLLLRSQELATGPWFNAGLTSITNNTPDVVAPDGLNTATKIVATGSGSAVGQSVTLTAAVHTGSIWLRTLSGTATLNLIVYLGASPFTNIGTTSVTVTSSWQRFTVVTSAATAAVYNLQLNTISANTIYAWGAQLEAGAFPTSYIPTTVAQVTRNPDVASVNTLSPWYNATEGTIYLDFAGRQAGIQPYLTMLSNTGETERIYQRYVGGQYQTIARVAGVDIANVYNSTEGSAVNAKIASAYNASQLATSTNGQAVTGFAVASLSSVPSGLNKLWLGSFTGTSAFANGYLRRLTYYPRRLTNAELQAITV